jgi:hypothetical protein
MWIKNLVSCRISASLEVLLIEMKNLVIRILVIQSKQKYSLMLHFLFDDDMKIKEEKSSVFVFFEIIDIAHGFRNFRSD